jgi:hypothetical protein
MRFGGGSRRLLASDLNKGGYVGVMAKSVRLRWFKSSRSATQADCVEVAFLACGDVCVRDSKKPDGSVLVFAPRQWDVFIAGVRATEFTRTQA